ncbi:MAG: NAD(P)H-dependent oxidoreductase subunit E [Candidatus Hydrogenedentes bacterium]|nr:NAD(P)H-dependent oxidoreductase subunit E [Candidatus Hydrogenedentota bacterium]
MDIKIDAGAVLAIANRHEGSHGALIAILEEIQSLYGYLPEAALRLVARSTDRSLVDVYGVATFYRAFSLKPRGKHHVCACVGTACHVRGASQVVHEFERQLKVKAGETTGDGQFTFETVNCLGACALGPIVTADKKYFSNVDPAGIKKILTATAAGERASGDEAKPRLHQEPELTASNM